MYEAIRKLLVLTALTAATFTGVAVGVLGFSVSDDVSRVSDHVIPVLDSADFAEGQIGTSVSNVAADVHRVAFTTQNTIDHVDAVVRDVHGQVIPQVVTLIRGAQLTNKQLQYEILQAGLATRAVHEAADKENTFLDVANNRLIRTMTLADSNLVNLRTFLQHSDQLMVSAKKGTDTADGILQDGKDEADKLVHPPKAKMTFWGATWLVTQKVHSILPPIF